MVESIKCANTHCPENSQGMCSTYPGRCSFNNKPSKPTIEKPPLGIMPESISEYNRIKDLSYIINKWVSDGHVGGEYNEKLIE